MKKGVEFAAAVFLSAVYLNGCSGQPEKASSIPFPTPTPIALNLEKTEDIVPLSADDIKLARQNIVNVIKSFGGDAISRIKPDDLEAFKNEIVKVFIADKRPALDYVGLSARVRLVWDDQEYYRNRDKLQSQGNKDDLDIYSTAMRDSKNHLLYIRVRSAEFVHNFSKPPAEANPAFQFHSRMMDNLGILVAHLIGGTPSRTPFPKSRNVSP